MDPSESNIIPQDGCQQTNTIEDNNMHNAEDDKKVLNVPPGGDAVGKKKKPRRRKSKRKLNKPYTKMPWYQRRNPIGKKINRNRKILMAQSNLHAPYNTNQFLMEVHMPEAEGVFQMPRAPSARTRDSSFSVDSEENYFFSLPEDEEDFLTKEFSSVYEDAQTERLASMTKEELVEENMLLEAKVEALTKRIINNRSAKNETDVSMSTNNSENDLTKMIDDLNTKLKEKEDKIRELETSNETLRIQNERLIKTSGSNSSSEDSESDSSSSSSTSSSSSSNSDDHNVKIDDTIPIENINNSSPNNVLTNGFMTPERSNNIIANGHDNITDGNEDSLLFSNSNGSLENSSEMGYPSVN